MLRSGTEMWIRVIRNSDRERSAIRGTALGHVGLDLALAFSMRVQGFFYSCPTSSEHNVFRVRVVQINFSIAVGSERLLNR